MSQQNYRRGSSSQRVTLTPTELVEQSLPAPATLEMITNEVWQEIYSREKESLIHPFQIPEFFGRGHEREEQPCFASPPESSWNDRAPSFRWKRGTDDTKCVGGKAKHAHLTRSSDIDIANESNQQASVPDFLPPTTMPPPINPKGLSHKMDAGVCSPPCCDACTGQNKGGQKRWRLSDDWGGGTGRISHETGSMSDTASTSTWSDDEDGLKMTELGENTGFSQMELCSHSLDGGNNQIEDISSVATPVCGRYNPQKKSVDDVRLRRALPSPSMTLVSSPSMESPLMTKSAWSVAPSNRVIVPTDLHTIGLLNAGGEDLLNVLPTKYPRHPRVGCRTRFSVVSWMNRAVISLDWPLSVFFIAAEAFDEYLWHGTNCSLDEEALPELSTASLLFGACLVAETTQATKAATFIGQVPNVTSSAELLTVMLKLATSRVSREQRPAHSAVDTRARAAEKGRMTSSSGQSSRVPLNRTPHDLICLYLARMRDSKKWSYLYNILREGAHLAGVMDAVLSASIYFVEMGGYFHVPASRLVAVVLMMLLLPHEQMLRTPEAAELFSDLIFGLSYWSDLHQFVLYLWPFLNQWALSPLGEHKPVIRALACSHPLECGLVSMKPGDRRCTFSDQVGLTHCSSPVTNSKESCCSPWSCISTTPSQSLLASPLNQDNTCDAATSPSNQFKAMSSADLPLRESLGHKTVIKESPVGHSCVGGDCTFMKDV
eukprot:GHVN01096926.1.p1 GENE.GHVN01096926.1~~GHVN01096926.1.p1  ORF type:complete len:717 (+),score=55.34 GHVN01096926.1:252-2402(+)